METNVSMMKAWSHPHVFIPTSIKIWISAMLVLGVFAVSAQAAIPFQSCVKQIQESEVKVIATVKSIEILDKRSDSHTKKITFKLEKSFSKIKIPKEFTGHRLGWTGDAVPGGWGFGPGCPKTGTRVFVTIRALEKEITSFTPMTPELYKALLHDRSRVVVNSRDRTSVKVAENPNDSYTKKCRVFKECGSEYKPVVDY